MNRSMKKTISKLTGQATPWLGWVFLSGLLAAGCQTQDESSWYSPLPAVEPAPQAIAVEPASPTNAVGVAALGTPPGTNSPFALKGERFAVGDLVRVVFSGITDPIQPHEERIKDDGNITLPDIGAIKADGKTPGELQKAITDAYVPDYYKRLTITVSSDRRVYYVGGQVRQPGRQEYIGTTTVTKAIQSAGDFTDFSDRRKVVLTRADGKTLTVNCLKAARDPALDPPVFPGDKIEVPMRGIW